MRREEGITSVFLNERYEVGERLGRGSMAQVYRGCDLRVNAPVAIKVLRDDYSAELEFATRWKNAIHAFSSVHHPFLVQVYDYVETSENSFVVMELVEGTNLQHLFRAAGTLSLEKTIPIARHIADALSALHHHSLVYRVLSPKKVLMGEAKPVKLSVPGAMFHHKYTAPEHFGGEIVSPAADVYALGMVMYEMLTGRTPFDGDTPVALSMQHIQDMPMPPSKLNPTIPKDVEEIILCCLEKLPQMRYPNGEALAQALERLV